jgi:hypothetical protein
MSSLNSVPSFPAIFVAWRCYIPKLENTSSNLKFTKDSIYGTSYSLAGCPRKIPPKSDAGNPTY